MITDLLARSGCPLENDSSSNLLAGSAKRRPSLSSPWCGLDPSVPMALSKRFKACRDPEVFCRHGPRWSQRLIWLQVGKYPCLHLTILHKPNVAWYSWEQAHAEGYRDGADLPLCCPLAELKANHHPGVKLVVSNNNCNTMVSQSLLLSSQVVTCKADQVRTQGYTWFGPRLGQG